MFETNPRGLLLAAACASALLAPTGASAATGGVSLTGAEPKVSQVSCAAAQTCARGEVLRVTGSQLRETELVAFLGKAGTTRDDRRARPVSATDGELTVQVPSQAVSGPVQLTTADGEKVAAASRLVISGAAPAAANLGAGAAFLDGAPATLAYELTAAPASGAAVQLRRAGAGGEPLAQWPITAQSATQTWNGTLAGNSAAPGAYEFAIVGADVAKTSVNGKSGAAFTLHDFVFPIRAKHDLGQTPVNDFGGARGHKGQDMFAACGAPLVAARGGTVTQSTFQARAGNYVVITTTTGESHVYMHLRSSSPLRTGTKVATGEPVGQVGDTGVASGCHLHFELWTAPGWMVGGGKAIDPLPTLRLWDAAT